jgi:hypothetical protein
MDLQVVSCRSNIRAATFRVEDSATFDIQVDPGFTDGLGVLVGIRRLDAPLRRSSEPQVHCGASSR